MKIFSSEQTKQWDKYTIEHEPVSSIDLMERAATACFNWIKNKFTGKEFKVFCGKGNNGGDGLVIARKLLEDGLKVSVFIIDSNTEIQDFETNLKKLQELTRNIYFIRSTESFPAIDKDEIVIDAIFGTGLNKPPADIFASAIDHINSSGAKIISIDIPSGLFADQPSGGNKIIKAYHTLTFQQKKLAFLMAENADFFGEVTVLDISLHKDFYNKTDSPFQSVDKVLINSIYKPRKQFSHKGDYGHACLICGSKGLMGAAVLATKACLRSGAGKVTAYTAGIGYEIMQISAPEAMTKTAGENFITDVDDLQKFDAIGIGPGLGLYETHKELLQEIFSSFQMPVVVDADALNILSKKNNLLDLLPENSIFTPHAVEFDRLFGKTENDFEKTDLAIQKASQHRIFIVLKGHHTLIATPEGKAFFNSTGNAGMATGGSGDVLTGIITGLLAQKYSYLESCILGVYLHGLAGDLAAEMLSQEALIAGDIINYLGDAFKQIAKYGDG